MRNGKGCDAGIFSTVRLWQKDRFPATENMDHMVPKQRIALWISDVRKTAARKTAIGFG